MDPGLHFVIHLLFSVKSVCLLFVIDGKKCTVEEKKIMQWRKKRYKGEKETQWKEIREENLFHQLIRPNIYESK